MSNGILDSHPNFQYKCIQIYLIPKDISLQIPCGGKIVRARFEVQHISCNLLSLNMGSELPTNHKRTFFKDFSNSQDRKY